MIEVAKESHHYWEPTAEQELTVSKLLLSNTTFLPLGVGEE